MEKKIITLIYLSFLLVFFSCRGKITEKEPIHLNPNMYFQPKLTAQDKPLLPPEGTIPYGRSIKSNSLEREQFLKEDTKYYFGKNSKGQYVKIAPIEINKKSLKRGQERFNIYCAVCHDQAGTGNGIVIQRNVGMPKPPDLARSLATKSEFFHDGRLFEVITEGIRNMPGYKTQISPEDRWNIVLYLRALQKSRNATLKDVPLEYQKKLK